MIYSTGYCHDITDADRAHVSTFAPSEQEHLRNKTLGLWWDQSFMGILIAKRLCSYLLGQKEQDVTLVYNSVGKPCVPGVHISISHCDDMVVSAVSKSPIGVDVERIRDDFPDLSRFCTPREQIYLSEAEDSLSFSERCCRIWTFKESYFKSLGSGIPDLRAICMFDYLHLIRQFTIGQYLFSFFIHPEP